MVKWVRGGYSFLNINTFFPLKSYKRLHAQQNSSNLQDEKKTEVRTTRKLNFSGYLATHYLIRCVSAAKVFVPIAPATVLF